MLIRIVLITLMQLQIAFAYDEVTFCTTLLCPDLSEHNMKCKYFDDEVDCLRSVNKNESQLGYASTLTSYVATQLLPNLEIVADVYSKDTPDRWILQVVVLTNRPVSSFDELKGFTYCNDGIGFTPKFMIDGIERAILKKHMTQGCGRKATFVEEQACNLNEFFGPSCRAGLWGYKDGEDTRKSDYAKLCQLCPEDKCFLGKDEELCLQGKRGAVAISIETYDTVGDSLKPNTYYLCKNGTTSTKPCVWYRQNKHLIFAHKSVRESISPKLNEFFSLCAIESLRDCLFTLGEVLTEESDPYITVLDEDETKGLIPVLEPYKLESSKSKSRRWPIRWCTVSDIEYEKCNWLKAFSGLLIYPIECVQEDSKESCRTAIELYEADMMEIVGLPIKGTIEPIALSTTPHTIYKYTNSPLELFCRDKFIHGEDRSINMKTVKTLGYSSFNALCPDGRVRHVCTNGTNEICHYHSEIIMRKFDPNRDNAKNLLADLIISFSPKSKTRPFNLFGGFGGVPNLLLQADTTSFFFLAYTTEVQTVAPPIYKRTTEYRENYEHPTIATFAKSAPRIPEAAESTSGYSSWGIFGICIAVALTIVLGYALFKFVMGRRSSNQVGYFRARTPNEI